MSDSPNGTPLPDENREPNPPQELPRLPRIAPPEGVRAARGQIFDDGEDDVDEISGARDETDGNLVNVSKSSDLDEDFDSDASIDPHSVFPEEELISPMGIDIGKDDLEHRYDTDAEEEAAEAERYRVSSLREDTPRDKEAGLIEHLNELRIRLLWCFASVGIGMCVTWAYNQELQSWFAKPIIEVLLKSPPKGTETANQLVSRDPMGFFTISFQFSLVAAIILVMPFIFFQAWRFIEPALTNSERRYTLVLVPFSSILFFLGAGLGFYVSPLFFKFFIQFQPDGIAAMWDYYDSLLIMAKMLIVFGIAFQVPIIVIFGVKIGILTREILIQYWRHAVVVIFVVCAVLTPTWDPLTLGICATPPCLLYALSIWLVKWL